MNGVTEDDNQVALSLQFVAQGFDARQFPALLDTHAGHCLIVFADRTRRHRINVCAVMAEVGARLKGQEWVLLRQIRRHHQNGFRGVHVGGGGKRVAFAGECIEKSCQIAGAVMIDILSAEALPGELRQEEILFVGGVIGADHSELPAACLGFAELGGNYFEGL